MNYKETLLLIGLTLISCTKKEYSQDECELLSMKKFKGYQRESHLFDKNCKKYKIHYSHARCQKALKQMILGLNIDALVKTHGKNIDQCFTENDLAKFSN